MLQYDFEKSVGYWVMTTARAMERRLAEELRPLGITVRQCQVLGWLALEGDLCQAELADRLGIEAPTLAGVLARMEKSGWISRRTCPDDRRRKLVSPTAAVGPVWERMTACTRRIRAECTRDLSPTKVKRLLETLATIRGRLEEPSR